MLRLRGMRLERIGAVFVLLAIAGCSDATDRVGPAGTGAGSQQPVVGEAALWRIDSERPPSPGDKSFTVLVERLGCNNGETGQVLAPEIVEEPDQVVITYQVAASTLGAASCPGNKLVPSKVLLSAAVGERTLIDGACLSGPSGTTSPCPDGAERWPASQSE